MKRLRWQITIVVLALGAIALLLLGQQPANQQAIIVPQPVTGGIYNEALIGTPTRFNPVLDFYNSADRDVDRLIFSGLVKFDAQGLPQADLAESWGISRDGTTYNFALRSNAIWHDGQPVTSDDVIFTIELLRYSDFPTPTDWQSLWKAIDIKRFDDKTLQFKLPEPFAPFLDYLTFGILPKHLLVNLTPAEIINAPFNLTPIGSGPYRLERLITDLNSPNGASIKGVSLVAFDGFYTQRPYIDQVIFKYYSDAPSALADYKDKKIQGISHVTPDILPDALVEPNLNLYSSRLPQLSLVFLNLANPQTPFFQEVEVRKALLMGINRQWIIDHYLNGQAIIAEGPIVPGTWAYYSGIQSVPYNPDDAIKKLKSAGYTIPATGGMTRAKEDQPLSFELLHPDDETHTKIAQTIQENWSLLGVSVTLKAVPYQTLIDEYLDTRNYQAALVDINLTKTPDPDPYPFWHQTQVTGGQNYANWEDRQASEYLEQARIIVDPGERARLYRNFQVRFINELPALPLYYPVYTYAVDASIQGIRIGPLFEPSDRFSTITNWFLVSRGTIAETPTGSP